MTLISRLRKSNITRCVWTQLAQITILCGIILVWSSNPTVSHTALMVTGAVFLIWLLWFLFILFTRRVLTAMPSKAYSVLDNIDCILFLFWVCVWIFSSLVMQFTIYVVLAAWIGSIIVAFRLRD